MPRSTVSFTRMELVGFAPVAVEYSIDGIVEENGDVCFTGLLRFDPCAQRWIEIAVLDAPFEDREVEVIERELYSRAADESWMEHYEEWREKVI